MSPRADFTPSPGVKSAISDIRPASNLHGCPQTRTSPPRPGSSPCPWTSVPPPTSMVVLKHGLHPSSRVKSAFMDIRPSSDLHGCPKGRTSPLRPRSSPCPWTSVPPPTPTDVLKHGLHPSSQVKSVSMDIRPVSNLHECPQGRTSSPRPGSSPRFRTSTPPAPAPPMPPIWP